MFDLLFGAVGLIFSGKFWLGVAAGAVIGGPSFLKAWAWLKASVGK